MKQKQISSFYDQSYPKAILRALEKCKNSQSGCTHGILFYFLGRIRENRLDDVNLPQMFKHLTIVPSGMTAQAGFLSRSVGGPSQPGAVRDFVAVLWR